MTTRTTNVSPALIDIGVTENNGQGTTLRTAGGYINVNFQDLYTTVNAIVDYTLPVASASLSGGVKVDGTSITINGSGIISSTTSSVSPATVAPLINNTTAAVGTSLLYARQDHVHPAGAVVPSGVIVMWSGLIAAIPVGWYLCDGTNGTPNLRNKFVIGAGSTYAVNSVGGTASAGVVSHSHALSSTNATFTGTALGTHKHTDSGHTHTNGIYANLLRPPYNGSLTGNDYTGSGSEQAVGPGNSQPMVSASAVISYESAGTPAGTISGSTDTTGASGDNANLPPYLALAYIMKS